MNHGQPGAVGPQGARIPTNQSVGSGFPTSASVHELTALGAKVRCL